MSARGVSRWFTLAFATAACGGPAQRAANTTAAAKDSVASTDSSGTAAAAGTQHTLAAPARPVAVAPGPNAFRHEKHRGLQCQRCHTTVPGHTVHTNVACTSCHASVPATGPIPAAAQCAACHHAATQPYPCANCHAPATRGRLTLTVNWQLSVWPAPRPRDVTFDHNWHTNLQCASCHTDRPAMVPVRACGSCHEHHDGKADCRTCHRPPPAGIHTVAAHDGCAGPGCHQSPPVRVATLSRNECLLCHADRVNHQPGRVCAQCHMLQPSRASQVGKEPESR